MADHVSPADLLRLVRRADLQDDPEAMTLVRAAITTPNQYIKSQAKQRLLVKAAQRQATPFEVDARPPTGEVQLGTSGDGPVGLSESDLTKHLLTVGQSGAGKTTLFYNLIAQLDVPFWVFDLKQDYRHLVTHEAAPDVVVLPWTKLKFNPLQPPDGVPPRRWAQVVGEIFGHATALLSGSKNHLVKSILELYRLYDLFEEVAPPYPSLHELKALLAAQPINYVRKHANYRDTVLNRVEAMTMGAGTIFDCSRGYPLADLLARNVVFEFDGLARDTQNFVMECLLAAVYEYRLAQTQRASGLRHAIILDEGKQVFSVYKERQDAAGIPAIDTLTAKLREFGEGLLVGDQEASKLTDSIKANTYTKILLPTGDRKQFKALAESMHLSDLQTKVAHDIDVGEAIVQRGNDAPVRVTLDDYPLAKDVTDADLRRSHGQTRASLTAEPRHRPARFEEVVGSHGTGAAESADPEVIDDPPAAVTLSDDANQLMKSIIDEPFVPLTERYDALSSRYAGDKAKTELVDADVVVERTVRTAGARRKLLELTDTGRTYAEQILECDPDHAGRGGIVHRYWQHHVQTIFEDAGWTTKRELFDADVYVNTGDTELVVEIAMQNTRREREHVETHLDQGFDAIWVVCRTATVRDGLQRRLEDAGIEMDNVVVRVVRDVSDALESVP